MTRIRTLLRRLDRKPSRAAVLYVWTTVLAILLVYGVRAGQLLDAVVDPFGAQLPLMKVALLGYVAYGAAVLAVILLIPFLFGPQDETPLRLRSAWTVLAGTLLVAGAHVDTVVFRDYGIHAYEYDLRGLFTTSSTLGDLGIRRHDLIAAGTGVIAVLVLGWGLYAALLWVAPRLHRGTGPVGALLLPILGVAGAVTFAGVQRSIHQDRHDFLSTLPLRGILIPGSTDRPHLAVAPLLGPEGYPDTRDPSTVYPELASRKNVILVLGDGLRATEVADSLGLTPNLAAFGARPDVIRSRSHHSTGPFTDMGVYGLVYGLNTYTYFPFMEHRVPSYPLEVFRRNGYRVAIVTASRLLQFPTSQVLDNFDERVTVDEDPVVLQAAADFIEARRRDGAPYFLVVFFYAPHWPFGGVEDQNRLDRPDLDDGERSAFAAKDDTLFRARARNGYRNSVRQFDTWFGRTFALVRDDFDAGRAVVGVTSDHGTELWEHGMLGQGRSTFWNEKIRVPLLLGLPGVALSPEQREPEMTSHVDLFPTLFEYLGATPSPDPVGYAHGRSILTPGDAPGERTLTLTGRYFPWADRMNAFVTRNRKVWFSVDAGAGPGDLVLVPERVLDAWDRPLAATPPALDSGMVAAFKASFWRFLRPVRGARPAQPPDNQAVIRP